MEGDGGSAPGLGLLPVTTLFHETKRTAQIRATAQTPWAAGIALEGYEIHMGRTHFLTAAAPLATITQRNGARINEPDGAISADGRVWGCYLHGLFANTAFRQAWLGSLGWQATPADPRSDPYERLADTVEQALEPARVQALLNT
jgi:adenosylcobyric acid synthase